MHILIIRKHILGNVYEICDNQSEEFSPYDYFLMYRSSPTKLRIVFL